MHRQPPVSAIMLAIVFTVCVSASSEAKDELRSGVAEGALKIAAVMKAIGAESASVLGFEDRTTLGATVLGGLEHMLSEELAKAGVTVRSSGGKVGVKGLVKAPQERFDDFVGPRFLRLELQLSDEFGEDLHSVNMQIPSPETAETRAQARARAAAGLDDFDFLQPSATFDVNAGRINQDFHGDASLIAFGANADLNPGAKNPFDAISDGNVNPTAIIAPDGVSAKASAESPFAVRIVSGGRAKPLRLVDGRPFVDLEPEERFTLILENNAPYKTDASIWLDGINSFRFSRLKSEDGSPRYTSWTVGRGKFQILGWHLDNETAQEFVATSYEKSKLRELGHSRAPVGAVTVIFRSAWDASGDVPVDEHVTMQRVELADGTVDYRPQERQMQYTSRTPDVYIGGGNEVSQQVREGRRTEIGRVRGVVTIRYRHPLAE